MKARMNILGLAMLAASTLPPPDPRHGPFKMRDGTPAPRRPPPSPEARETLERLLARAEADFFVAGTTGAKRKAKRRIEAIRARLALSAEAEPCE